MSDKKANRVRRFYDECYTASEAARALGLALDTVESLYARFARSDIFAH